MEIEKIVGCPEAVAAGTEGRPGPTGVATTTAAAATAGLRARQPEGPTGRNDRAARGDGLGTAGERSGVPGGRAGRSRLIPDGAIGPASGGSARADRPVCSMLGRDHTLRGVLVNVPPPGAPKHRTSLGAQRLGPESAGDRWCDNTQRRMLHRSHRKRSMASGDMQS